MFVVVGDVEGPGDDRWSWKVRVGVWDFGFCSIWQVCTYLFLSVKRGVSIVYFQHVNLFIEKDALCEAVRHLFFSCRPGSFIILGKSIFKLCCLSGFFLGMAFNQSSSFKPKRPPLVCLPSVDENHGRCLSRNHGWKVPHSHSFSLGATTFCCLTFCLIAELALLFPD